MILLITHVIFILIWFFFGDAVTLQYRYFEKATCFCTDILNTFLQSIWSSLCFSNSMYRFIQAPLSVICLYQASWVFPALPVWGEETHLSGRVKITPAKCILRVTCPSAVTNLVSKTVFTKTFRFSQAQCYACSRLSTVMYQSNWSFNIPRAYPGHLTSFLPWEGGNLITTHREWGIWSLAEMSNFDEFKGKDYVFGADWLKTKGLHKLCSVFEGV